MKTLFLLRHAKSDWSDGTLRDHDRPLSNRGRRAAPSMADFMDREGYHPEVVLCSTARRTRETWKGMSARLGSDATVVFEETLYGASPSEILSVVAGVDDDVRRVLVVGHNPGIEEFASALAGRGQSSDLLRLDRKFPTGALAVLSADVKRWGDLVPGACTLVRFVRPKDLPEADDVGL